jgi:alcohol dehydrogenase class IV
MTGNLRALQTRAPDDPVLPRFTTVARLLTGDPAASAEDGVAWIDTLVRELGVPRLGAYGLTPADVPAVAAQAARASSMKANPIQLETEELERILAAAI